METNIIHNADCRDILLNIPDNSIDLVVTDCPYKIVAGGVRVVDMNDECSGVLSKRAVSDGTPCSNKWLKKDVAGIPSAVKQGKMFSNNDIEFADWLPDIYRVLKPGSHCYIMINGRNLKDLQTEAEKVGFVFQNLLVWDKGNVTPNKYYMQGVEFILLLSKRPARNVNDMGISNLISIPNLIGNIKHPTEKPVKLMEVFIRQSSKPGDVVFDPFCGSGSTLLACQNTGRDFIGVEIDPDYVGIANTRLSNLQS